MESSFLSSIDRSLVRTLADFQLMPYLYDVTRKASLQNTTCLLSMAETYPENPVCHSLEGQYMIGRHLLVIPVHHSDTMVEYYLPHGIWTNYLTGESLPGNQWHTTHVTVQRPILMVCENAVIPTAISDDQECTRIQFRVYALQNKIRIAGSFYDQYTSKTWHYLIRRINHQITISSDTCVPYSFRLMNQAVKEADHAFVIEEQSDTIVEPDAKAAIMTLNLI